MDAWYNAASIKQEITGASGTSQTLVTDTEPQGNKVKPRMKSDIEHINYSPMHNNMGCYRWLADKDRLYRTAGSSRAALVKHVKLCCE